MFVFNNKKQISKLSSVHVKIISEDKDIFFQVVKDQFDKATNINKRVKEKKKVLKMNND